MGVWLSAEIVARWVTELMSATLGLELRGAKGTTGIMVFQGEEVLEEVLVIMVTMEGEVVMVVTLVEAMEEEIVEVVALEVHTEEVEITLVVVVIKVVGAM